MGFWGIPINVKQVQTNPFDSDVSTTETIRQMIAIARISSQSPNIAAIVDSCIRHLPKPATNQDLARAIFWWIKGHVTFCTDEQILGEHLGFRDVNQELLIAPDQLLAMPQPMGDCDDFSILAASLLLCAGIPVWFVTVAVDPEEPFRFSHVYCTVGIEGRKIPFDVSHGKNLGWETQREKFRRQEWYVG